VQVRNPDADPVLASVAAERMANTGACCWDDGRHEHLDPN
jgi:hypothetical protein